MELSHTLSRVGNLSQIYKPQVLASGSAKFGFDSGGRNSVFLGHSGVKLQLRGASQRSLRKHQLRVSAENDAEKPIIEVSETEKETVQNIADNSQDVEDKSTEESKNVMKATAGQLMEQAETLRAQADSKKEDFLSRAGSTAEDIKAQVGKTAEDLKALAEKATEQLRKEQGITAAQIQGEADKAQQMLIEQADKAGAQLAAQARETSDAAKVHLAAATENAHPAIKSIADTAIKAHSGDAAAKGGKIHDFCLGIPYGALLVLGGLLWFLMAGSTDALRFGVGFGGILLAASYMSLRCWQESKSSAVYLIAQAAISVVLLIKEVGKFAKSGALFPTGLTALVSAIMVAFYTYVFLAGGNRPKKITAAENSAA